MYNGLLTACDSCATPLDGQHGTAKITKNHIVLKGNIGLLEFTKEKPEGFLYWAKKQDEHVQYHFCNTDCLNGFLQAKMIMRKEWYKKNKDLQVSAFDY